MKPRDYPSLRFVLVIAVVALVSISVSAVRPHAAKAYACGATCGGYHRWDGAMNGAHTRISQVAIIANDPGGGWVKARQRVCSTNCAEYVEAGITADSSRSKTNRYYYFEDMTNANGFNHNFLAWVPSGEIGYRLNVWMWKNASSWSIDLTSTKSGGYHFAGYSTPNYMNAVRIDVGSVLYGTSGSTSPTIHYTDNAYNSGGNWIYQYRPNPSPGDYDSPSQPGIITCGWVTKPSVLNSAGGDWKASIP